MTWRQAETRNENNRISHFTNFLPTMRLHTTLPRTPRIYADPLRFVRFGADLGPADVRIFLGVADRMLRSTNKADALGLPIE